ncbi:MAG: NifB/NifX family molybdenum-iron cluster-binding protein [Anaerolineales bacterium]
MKIAISANSGDPDRQFSSRFGRCSCFLVTDPEGETWQEIDNPAADAQGGAGSQVVQLLADHGVDAVISGRYGPNAYEALQAAGMEAYLARSGSARDLVRSFSDGELKLASGPTGRGQHAGRGRGGRW